MFLLLLLVGALCVPITDTSEVKRRAVRARWDRPENVDRRVDALAEHVAKVVATLPPLTEAQKAELRAVIAPALTDGPGA